MHDKVLGLISLWNTVKKAIKLVLVRYLGNLKTSLFTINSPKPTPLLF